MFNLGPTEIILILGVALVIFGPGKLPELGATLGKAIREFKTAVNHVDADIKKEVNDIQQEVKDVKESVNLKGAMQDLRMDLNDTVIDVMPSKEKPSILVKEQDNNQIS